MQMPKRLIVGAAAVVALVAVAVGAWSIQRTQTRQAMIHEHGAHVMPFDLAKTLHVFEKTSAGGVQTVVVREASDAENLAHIRMHLRMEADSFARGDFSDPAQLHGPDMPGISTLEKNRTKMTVTYRDVSNGGQIAFQSADAETVLAIHQWFDAQLADHGQDAVER